MRRKEALVKGEVYHIYNKSIANFRIFNNKNDFLRIRSMIKFYQVKDISVKFSQFVESEKVRSKGFNKQFLLISGGKEKLVQIIAYCSMPTHLHLILKQLKDNGISIFIGNTLNSYSRYFNLKYKRKGPLWEGRFKNALVKTDEQLLHLTRYLHLNPTSVGLVDRPEDWKYSSYNEYLGKVDNEEKTCFFEDIIDILPRSYKKFVDDRISYQRKLEIIKHIILE